MSRSWVLFPRLHLAEIEDQTWCPSWLREHSHRALSRMWQTSNSKRGSPATQACQIILQVLGGTEEASHYVFVDSCAGAGGPTPLLEKEMNRSMRSSGQELVEFVMTDLYPDLEAWKAIASRSQQVSYIEKPIDATRPMRLAKSGYKECRIFNLCFHHFDDDAARKVLSSAIQSTDAFVYVTPEPFGYLADSKSSIFEMTHRTLPSLLNTTIVIFSCLFTTIFDFYWSPSILLFTYLIPLVPLFYMVDGYVSCTRGRTEHEISELLEKQKDLDLSGWRFESGEQTALLPFGRLYWYAGVKIGKA